MPYANEHACRLVAPAGFQKGRFRRVTQRIKNKVVGMIFGRLKGESKTTLQSVRFPKGTWSAKDARAVCKELGGTFEAAVAKAENPLARFVRVMKALVGTDVAKAAVPFQNLALAEDNTTWDAAKARAQLRRWASSDSSGHKDTINWAKYRRGFVWYDAADKENLGAYKLPIAYVANGSLKAVPKGIMASMAVVLGARGGVDVGGDRRACYNHLKRYYPKMKREPPQFGGSVAKSWAGMDDGQVREAITEALRGRPEFAREGDSDVGPWAQHLFEDHAIVRGTGGKLYRVDISELMGELVIGDPIEVQQEFAIVKRDDEQHLVTGVVLQPDMPDAQDDVMTAAEIEKAAHAYMKQGAQVRVQHGDGTTAGYADVVESWTAPQDIKFGEEIVKAGAWLMTMHVPDDNVWAQVKAGDFTGFSPRGIGYREVTHA